jgi:hypothetical protein
MPILAILVILYFAIDGGLKAYAKASEIFDTLYDDLEEFGYETGNIWYLED